MRVAIVNTMDIKGGAARAAFRLHKGLRGEGVESTYHVRDQQNPATEGTRTARKAARDATYDAYPATRSPDIELFSQEQGDGFDDFFTQMPRADVTGLPSRQDNLPNTFLESFACGTPVVGFRVGGIPDLVREDETGFLAADGHVPGLSLAFMKAFGDPEHRRACGQRARALVERDYTLAANARAYMALYEDMIANG